MATSYTNCLVELDGVQVYATSANFSSSKDTQKIKALGYSGSAMVATDKPLSSVSVDCYVVGSALGTFLDKFKGNAGTFTIDMGSMGEATSCRLTSFGMNGDSQGIITASIGAETADGLGGGSAAGEGALDIEPAIGAKSTASADDMGFNAEIFSFSYDMSQSFERLYSMGGGGSPDSVSWLEGEESITLEGAGGGAGVSTALCPEADGSASVVAKSCDGSTLMTIAVSNGILTSSDVGVAEGDVIKGSATLTAGLSATPEPA